MAFANLFNFMNNVNRAATPIHSFLGSIFRWCQCPQGTGVYWAMRKYLWLQGYKLNIFAHYLHWNFPFSHLKYSLVPNIRGVPNKRGGWFFFQKLTSVAPPYFRDLKVFNIAILFFTSQKDKKQILLIWKKFGL